MKFCSLPAGQLTSRKFAKIYLLKHRGIIGEKIALWACEV